MASRGSKTSAGGSRKQPATLDRLKPQEAQEVLRQLLDAHPELASEAQRSARSLLENVECEEIADDVDDAVRALDFDDLNAKAGPHDWGYVGPTDAAWEILEEALEPFLQDMHRCFELGMESEALEICKGMLLGLYRLAHGPLTEVMEYAQDFPAEAAGRALKTWRTGGDPAMRSAQPRDRGKRPAFPADFIEQSVPDWRDLIARALAPAKRR